MPIPEGEGAAQNVSTAPMGVQHEISQQMKQQASCKLPPGPAAAHHPQGRGMASSPPSCNATNHSTTHHDTTHSHSHDAIYLKLLMTARGFRATAGSGGTAEIIGLLVAVGGSPVDILVAMAGDDNPGVINVAGGGRKAVVIEGWAAIPAAVRSMADRGSPNKGERDGQPGKETQTK